MKYLPDMTVEQLAAELESLGEKRFRAKQILEWVWRKDVVDFDGMTSLSLSLRQRLSERLEILTGRVVSRAEASDSVIKLLLQWPDGEQVETVWIPSSRRATACISTQAGCAMGCGFCASGLDGLQRNLSAGEIIEQVLQLQQATGQKVTNVVFMGMGEPLANYDATVRAVRALIDPARGGLSARRITVSTVGLPKQIRRLAGEDLPITLAISLHAPDDALRAKLMPTAARHSLADVLSAAEAFYLSRKREVTLEYTLLGGLNDTPDCADTLADLAARLRCNVNLIRYNPVPDLPYRRPTEVAVAAFAERLGKRGLNVNIRRSRGIDAQAACGQLKQRNCPPQAAGDTEQPGQRNRHQNETT